MCGRFALEAPWDVVVRLMKAEPVDDSEWSPAYNICPTDPAPVVRTGNEGGREVAVYRWGLVPFWAKAPKIGARLINARAETVATKSAFKGSFSRMRCLVPASGFYEWTAEPGAKKGKQPHWIHRAGGGVLTFAGLYAKWRAQDGSTLRSFTIITTEANADVAALHDRMPVVLAPDARDRWLDPDAPRAELQDLLAPGAPGKLTHHPVSKAVSNVRADGRALIEPLPPAPGNLELIF